MDASDYVAVGVITVLLYALGVVAVAWPDELQRIHLSLYDRYPGVKGADPFIAFHRSREYAVWIRIVGVLALLAALVPTYLIVRQLIG